MLHINSAIFTTGSFAIVGESVAHRNVGARLNLALRLSLSLGLLPHYQGFRQVWVLSHLAASRLLKDLLLPLAVACASLGYIENLDGSRKSQETYFLILLID